VSPSLARLAWHQPSPSASRDSAVLARERIRARFDSAARYAGARVRSTWASTSAANSNASELSQSHLSMMMTAASDPHVLLYEPKNAR
jgi:hypothetical protein